MKKKNITRFVGEIIGTGVTGAIAGIAGALIGALIMRGRLSGFGDLAGAIMGFLIGYTVGVSVGIVLIKKVLHQNGSILVGIFGSILGTILTMALAEPLNLNQNPNILFGVFFLSVPLLSVAGFHLKRWK